MGITSKAGKLLLIVGAICLTNVATTPLPKDKQCTTQKGTIGVCRNVDDCPLHSWNVSDEGDPRASACGSNGRQRAEVCCSLDSRTPQRPRGAGNTAPRPSSRSQTTPNAPASKTKSEQSLTLPHGILEPLPSPEKFQISGNDKRGTPLDPVKRISEQKCEEYINKTERLTLTSSGKQNYVLCSRNVLSGRSAIFGGQHAEQNEFPHMAAVGSGPKGEEKWWCGGILISPNYVLTAAHCMNHKDNMWVRLGTVNVTYDRDLNLEQNFVVVERTAHPGFRWPHFYHDIGLLRLDREVRFTRAVKPACLYVEDENISRMPDRAYATGWGHNENGTMTKSLMKVALALLRHNVCKLRFETINDPAARISAPDGIKQGMLCAGGDENGEKDTCHGDSGGPLQLVKHPAQCIYTVLGITSFGGTTACGNPNVPAVYTRVSSYLSWIENIVWPSKSSLH